MDFGIGDYYFRNLQVRFDLHTDFYGLGVQVQLCSENGHCRVAEAGSNVKLVLDLLLFTTTYRKDNVLSMLKSSLLKQRWCLIE